MRNNKCVATESKLIYVVSHMKQEPFAGFK